MSILFEPLPYAYDALEPQISEEIMQLHHNKHLKKYVDNVNSILKEYPEYENMTLKELIIMSPTFPKNIQQAMWNNAGGVYNHNLFFESMGRCSRERPQGVLLQAIEERFGSFETFKEVFQNQATGLFGAGFTWLALDEKSELCIVNTPNQDTILVQNLRPILLLDVWEHAYYLQYKNVRTDYIKNWFAVICWDVIEQRYANLL
jgi:Superoxide dismutase